jgi:BirA family biotin operon repressor/biotin-[acetyl-CoA-carboxylase] ligase
MIMAPTLKADADQRPHDLREPAINMGVGINVNSSALDYANLGRAVTTLKDICGQKLNRETLLQMLIANLERAIGQFRAFGIRPWVNAWRKMDQFIGARGTIVVNNHCTDGNRESGEGSIKKTGTILDMQEDGSLLFKCDDGTVETVYSADLEI